MPTLTPQQVEDAARAMSDHTLATSFLEPDARARVIALLLFAHEIGRARAVVSESGLAAIRLQWWRDTVEQIYSGKVVRAQPTAIALAGAIQEANLPRTLLDAMIDGHEQELEASPFQKWADLDAYLDATFGNLNRLSLLASGLNAITTDANDVARQAGMAWGLAHLLRVMPQWSMRRTLWLPKEVCGGLDVEEIYAGRVSPSLLQVLRAAQARVCDARRQTNTCLGRAKLAQNFPAVATACLSRRYAKAALPKVGPTWIHKPDVSLLERQARLTISVATGRA